MKWSDFSPYVLPHVIGCSEPLLEQHARKIGIEFCRRTMCYQRTLDEVLANGTPLVELELPTGTQIVKIKGVKADGRPWTIVDPLRGMDYVRSESPEDFCFTQDGVTLMLYQPQVAGVPIEVTAALMPTINSTTLEDAVANQYLYDIAPGIIASIMRVKGQPYSDTNESAVHQAQFEARVRTIGAKIGRGQAAAKVPSHITLL